MKPGAIELTATLLSLSTLTSDLARNITAAFDTLYTTDDEYGACPAWEPMNTRLESSANRGLSSLTRKAGMVTLVSITFLHTSIVYSSNGRYVPMPVFSTHQSM